MKLPALLVLASLLAPAFSPPVHPLQEEPAPKKKAENSVTRFFQDQAERLAKDVQGSWMVIDYVDPAEAPIEGAASGFATFHDGFLTLILSIDTFEERLFRAREFILLQTGAYRYRFDAQGMLQLANVVSYTNQSEDGDLRHEPSGLAYEYTATIADQVLELHNTDGVRITFRRLAAGDFPDSAIRKLESRRSGLERWEDIDEKGR